MLNIVATFIQVGPDTMLVLEIAGQTISVKISGPQLEAIAASAPQLLP